MELIEFCRANFHLLFDMDGRLEGLLYPYEIDMLNHINDKDYTLILKSRRMNISSIYALYIYWFLNYNISPKNEIIIIKDNYTSTINKHLRKLINGNVLGVGVANDDFYQYNGNSITLKGVNQFRGMRFDNIHMVIVDDFSDYTYIKNMFHIIMLSMDNSPNTKMSMSNTSIGDNYFRTLWEDGSWYNYLAHYSKNPYWTYKKLNDYTANIDNFLNWHESMECIYVTDKNINMLNSEIPNLTPYKSKTILKRIDSLVKQLHD